MLTASAYRINFKRENLSDETLLTLYQRILKPRLIEEKMLILLRQGQVSKWFSGIGQEAIAVGAASALLPDELVFTLHRNLGVFTVREVPLAKLFSQWQGKKSGFSKGRERSFHFGTLEYGIVGMISHLGLPDFEAGRTFFSFFKPFLLMSLGYFARLGVLCSVLISIDFMI